MFRKPVSISDFATALSTNMASSSASERTKRTVAPIASRGCAPARRMSVTTREPALMNGLRGTPCSYSSWTIELKALPDGSRPTRRHNASPTLPRAKVSANIFATLWDRERRITIASAAQVAFVRQDCDAEAANIRLGKFRDIGGRDPTFAFAGHFCRDLLDNLLEILRHVEASQLRAAQPRTSRRQERS